MGERIQQERARIAEALRQARARETLGRLQEEAAQEKAREAAAKKK